MKAYEVKTYIKCASYIGPPCMKSISLNVLYKLLESLQHVWTPQFQL